MGVRGNAAPRREPLCAGLPRSTNPIQVPPGTVSRAARTPSESGPRSAPRPPPQSAATAPVAVAPSAASLPSAPPVAPTPGSSATPTASRSVQCGSARRRTTGRNGNGSRFRCSDSCANPFAGPDFAQKSPTPRGTAVARAHFCAREDAPPGGREPAEAGPPASAGLSRSGRLRRRTRAGVGWGATARGPGQPCSPRRAGVASRRGSRESRRR